MSAGERNLRHALGDFNGDTCCEDPECELHQPQVIEDENQRLTALAWFLAGAAMWDEYLTQEQHPREVDFLRRHGVPTT